MIPDSVKKLVGGNGWHWLSVRCSADPLTGQPGVIISGLRSDAEFITTGWVPIELRSNSANEMWATELCPRISAALSRAAAVLEGFRTCSCTPEHLCPIHRK